MKKIKNLIMILYISLCTFGMNFCTVFAGSDDFEVVFEAPPTSNHIGFDNEAAVANRLGIALEYGQMILNGLSGIGTICCIAAFLVTAFKLGAMNPNERQKAIGNLWILAGLAAALGAMPIIISLIAGLLTNG